MSARMHTVQPAAVAVMRAPEQALQRKCACGSKGASGLTGECDECSGKKLTLQRYPAGGAAAEPSTPPIVHETLRSTGQPLDASTRTWMESRFGHDFSRVRVHTDARAAESARAVGALAYTVGRDIVFAAGRYAPETTGGRRLLAHEMTHVLQQQSASAGSSSPRVQLAGGHRDRYETEADAVADQVMSASAPRQSSAPRSLAASVAPLSLMMTPDECVNRCKEDFERCRVRSSNAQACLGQLSVCQRSCAPPPEAPPPPKEAPAPEKPAPSEVPKVCDPPKGPGNHPKTVSQTMIDRWMGKHEKEGDHGEGCIPKPYIAKKNEHVCTIGYGHQIPDCPIVLKSTGQPLTLEERLKTDISELKCACEGKTIDCKGSEAETQLRRDTAGKVNHVHKVVPVDLNQAEFDAMVDISLHAGHFPADLLDAVKKYWCTPEGKDKVREIYLKTALTAPGSKKIESGFVNRRKHRVWPPSSG